MLTSRALRLWIGVAAGLLLLWALAWLALPPLLQWQLQTRGSELLGRELRVGGVEFAPASLALTLHDLSLAGAGGAEAPQLQVQRVFVDLDARSLLRLAPVVSEVEIDAPRLRLTRLADGRYDIDDLLQRFAAAPADPAAEPQRFALFNLRIADGEFSFDDRPVGRTHVLRQLSLSLPFLSNLPDDLQVKVEPRLAFELDGSRFDNQGRSTPFAEGRASELQIRFDALALEPLWAYLPDALPLRPVGGRLSADLKLNFEQPPQQPPNVELSGRVELQRFDLQDTGRQPLLSWEKLQVQLGALSLRQRRLHLTAVQLDGAQLHLRREADGRLQLQRLAAALPAQPAAADAPAPWQLQLDALALQGAQLHWSDASLQPAAEAGVQDIALTLQQLRWPFEADAGLRLQATLHAQGRSQGRLQAEGAFTDQRARLALQLVDVDAALAQPYLQALLRGPASARLQAEATLDWAGGDAPRLRLAVPSLRVDELKLTEAAPRRGAAGWQLARLQLDGLQADLLQRRVEVTRLSLQQPSVELSRDAEGRFDLDRWFVLPPAPAAAEDASPPWQLALRELQLDGGHVRLADAALPAGPLDIAPLRLRVQGLVWPAAAPLDTQLSASLQLPQAGSAAGASRLDWRGRVALQPPTAQGQLRLERFPMHVFEPLFGAALPVALQRLEAGFQGQVDLALPPQGPSLQLRGDALLADLRILARDAATELLSWNAMAFSGLDVALQPGSRPRVEIGELRISDYYSRLEITEEGRFNLQTVAAKAPGGAAAPAASAPAAEVGAPVTMLSQLPFDLVVGATQFSNGKVDFNDRFIRPNYSARLSELNGRIGRLDSRTRDMATLQFEGRVAGTGLLEIGGALNPTVIPPALDIKAKAHDIELPGLTPYSSKYAGYPIERGKLSVDVAYRIESDGKLEASNQIVVNQLTFGPRTDSPDATKLPVPLVVALLQDKNGVIDLDIPLTGSVSDPQFSLGALFLQVVGNLFSKIVSSPFAALEGGGKDLNHIDFRPGTAMVAAGGDEVIAKVAKALDDRPRLKLGIVATADPVGEAEAMRRSAFEASLRDEQRRERDRGALGSSGANADLPPLTGEQRARLVARLYEDARLPDKPRNVIGMTKDIPADQMEAMLLAAIPVDDAAARQLAQLRARTVREALMAKGLPGERLFIGESRLRGGAEDNAAWVPQAQLTLSVN